jgi:hypothetical protein
LGKQKLELGHLGGPGEDKPGNQKQSENYCPNVLMRLRSPTGSLFDIFLNFNFQNATGEPCQRMLVEGLSRR